jgi:hypothetical protein
MRLTIRAQALGPYDPNDSETQDPSMVNLQEEGDHMTRMIVIWQT